MKTLCSLLAACMLCVGLAACGDSAALLAPGGPRFDGGGGFGSGNRYVGSDSTMTADDPAETTAGGGTAGRGGGGFGSGN